MNTAIILSYDGTAYHGWQTQRNASSVQQTVTEALASLLGQDVSVSGVGRTDAGVHARRYVANFHGTHTIPMDRLPFAINAHLPMDIAVSGAALVPDDFDARFNCTRKEYTYLIAPGKIRDPFAVSRSYFYPYSLDVDAMQRAAAYLVGTHDFRALSSVNKRFKKSTVRTITQITITRKPREICFDVIGTGFLYNMVRILIGTLVEVGEGKRAPDSMPAILDSLDRQQAGVTMPPQGLTLEAVLY